LRRLSENDIVGQTSTLDMQMSRFLIIVTITLINIIIGASYLVLGLYHQDVQARYLLKPLIPLCLLGQTLLLSPRSFLIPIYFLSAIGDELLIPNGNLTFMLGMSVFAVNYLLLALSGPFHLPPYWFPFTIAIVVFTSTMMGLLPPILLNIAGQTGFVIAILIYVVTMWLSGVTNFYRWMIDINVWDQVVLFWGTLFLITADVLLIYNLVLINQRWVNAINLIVYWIGLTILGLQK
jgi:YhhN family